VFAFTVENSEQTPSPSTLHSPSPPKKNNNNRVAEIELIGESATTIETLLNYIYNQPLEVGGKQAVQLVKAATFYGLPELEQDCLREIILNTTPDNVWDLIHEAETLNMVELWYTLVDLVVQMATSSSDILREFLLGYNF
jgi:hypothetical protein